MWRSVIVHRVDADQFAVKAGAPAVLYFTVM